MSTIKEANGILNKLMVEPIPKMLVVVERPPVWDDVCKMIGGAPRNAIFAWNNTIYNPDDIHIEEFLIVHEEVHQRQQIIAGGAEKWWSRYIDDPYFRVDQEAPAYAAQYLKMCERVGDRNARYRILHQLALSLSGVLYGSTITHSKALQMIRERANV